MRKRERGRISVHITRSLSVKVGTRPPVLLVKVERGARIVDGRVLSRLDVQAQLLRRQHAQRARLGPPPRRARAHQRRVARRVADVLAWVAQLQHLRAGATLKSSDVLHLGILSGEQRVMSCKFLLGQTHLRAQARMRNSTILGVTPTLQNYSHCEI